MASTLKDLDYLLQDPSKRFVITKPNYKILSAKLKRDFLKGYINLGKNFDFSVFLKNRDYILGWHRKSNLVYICSHENFTKNSISLTEGLNFYEKDTLLVTQFALGRSLFYTIEYYPN